MLKLLAHETANTWGENAFSGPSNNGVKTTPPCRRGKQTDCFPFLWDAFIMRVEGVAQTHSILYGAECFLRGAESPQFPRTLPGAEGT